METVSESTPENIDQVDVSFTVKVAIDVEFSLVLNELPDVIDGGVVSASRNTNLAVPAPEFVTFIF
jgi:hypothetical protein